MALTLATADTIQIARKTAIEPASLVTVWIRAKRIGTGSTNARLFAKVGQSGTATSWGVQSNGASSTDFNATVRIGSTQYSTGSYAIFTNTTSTRDVFIVTYLDGSNFVHIQLWSDGVMLEDRNTGVVGPISYDTATGADLFINGNGVSTTGMNSVVYDFAVWNTNLTSAQMDLIRKSNIKGIVRQIQGSNLQIYMPFDDGAEGQVAAPLKVTTMIDSAIRTEAPTTNYGTVTGTVLGGNGTDAMLQRFTMPTLNTVLKAENWAYERQRGGQWNENLYRVLRMWSETGVTWNTYDGINAWGTAGALAASDYVSASVKTVANQNPGWLTWNITDWIQGYADGSLTNYGWKFHAAVATSFDIFETREVADQSLAPYVLIWQLGSGALSDHSGTNTHGLVNGAPVFTAENLSSYLSDSIMIHAAPPASSSSSSSSSSSQSSSSSSSSSSSLSSSSSSSSSTSFSSSSSSSSSRSSSSSSSSRSSSSSSSSSRSSSSSSSSSSSIAASTLTIQGSGVTDTYIDYGAPITNFASSQDLIFSHPYTDNTWQQRILLKFNVSSLPTWVKVFSAVLTLNWYSGTNGNTNQAHLGARRVLKPWNPTQVTWNNWDSTHSWGVYGAQNQDDAGVDNTLDLAGADCLDTPEDTVTIPGLQLPTGDLSWNIPVMVQQWINGSVQNNGLVIAGLTEDQAFLLNAVFRSSEYSGNTALRPKLVIQYYGTSSSSSSSSSSRSSSSSSRSSSSSSSSSRSSSSSSRSSSSSSSSSKSSSSLSLSSSSRSSSSRSSSSSSLSSSSLSSSSSSISSSSSSSSSFSSSSSSAFTSAGQTYTRGDRFSLPTDSENLETAFSASDYTNVGLQNAVRIANPSFRNYALFQFKDLSVGGVIPFTATWRGRSNLSPSVSAVYLQLFNRLNGVWDTVASNAITAANTDFTLSAFINTNYANYFDTNFTVTSRVFQQAA